MQFEISKESLAHLEQLIEANNNKEVATLLGDIHFADITEILHEISFDNAIYVFKLLDSEQTADVLAELDEELREKILKALSAKEIAKEINKLATDDAADIIAELPEDKKDAVIAELEDINHAKDIVDLLRYDDDIAGGIMGKELVKVNENWKIFTCVREMRKQAEEIDKVHTVYVVDDVIDLIKEEAEKDYQMAAGLTEDVEADDTIFELIKGRLPWLVLGLIGGLGSVFILQDFEEIMANPTYRTLFFFTPLIAAMAGNVGVQSSAIVVQGLANNIIKGSMWDRLIKELSISVINGIALSLLIFLFGYIMQYDFNFSLAISISLVAVIIIAALIGTFVPIILHKKGIDPALATGPFITTSNDIFGIFIFFYIAQVILGF